MRRAGIRAHFSSRVTVQGPTGKRTLMSDASSASTAGNDTYATEHSFASLGIATPMVDALAAQGIVTAFPIQAMTIADALAGRDTCGKAKTGSGKTLGFGLPLLQRVAEINARDGRHEGPVARPRGLVLLPTRELAVQVFEVIETLGAAMGLSVVAVYGGADIEKQIKQMRAGVDVIIATPGRLIDLGDRGEVKVDGLDILVLDEADRMADMGFMPQVEWVLRRLADRPHQTLLFSATLDGAVDRLVKRYMNDPIFHEVASDSQTVSLMVHHFFAVHKMDRNKVLATICKAQNKTIIFCRTKRGADRVVEDMEKEGVKAAAIHGDLRQAQRERALADFSTDALPVLVATDVAARGLHIDGVDCVVHFDPPEDHKAYLHRSGRTARAGSTGVVVSLLLWNQMVEAEIIMRRIEIKRPIVEVFSNNPHLTDLANWEPTMEESVL